MPTSGPAAVAVTGPSYRGGMSADRVWTAAEMEAMTPDERARIVAEGFRNSLDNLDPEFRARVQAKSRRIVNDLGLLDPDA